MIRLVRWSLSISLALGWLTPVTVLASYSYDALGRRVTATIGSTVTRYYYDGQNVIEERDGADVRVRTGVPVPGHRGLPCGVRPNTVRE